MPLTTSLTPRLISLSLAAFLTAFSTFFVSFLSASGLAIGETNLIFLEPGSSSSSSTFLSFSLSFFPTATRGLPHSVPPSGDAGAQPTRRAGRRRARATRAQATRTLRHVLSSSHVQGEPVGETDQRCADTHTHTARSTFIIGRP